MQGSSVRAPTFTPEAHAWLAEATGLREDRLSFTRLRGATSSSLYLVGESGDAGGRRFVLRLFTLARWLEEEPDLARHEVAALTAAAATGLRVPAAVAFLPGPSQDDPHDPVGFGAPAVLMTHLEGRVELRPTDERRWLRVMAETLAAIHARAAPAFGWRYASWVEPANVRVPEYAADPALWEAAVEAYRRWRRSEPGDTFLHRDYHALNLLFAGHGAGLEVAGVVDWVNACVGPAAADVSHCRIDLTQMKGAGAAERFLHAYAHASGGFEYDPVWDLEGAFDVAVPAAAAHAPWREFGVKGLGPEVVEARVEEHVRRALAELGAR